MEAKSDFAADGTQQVVELVGPKGRVRVDVESGRILGRKPAAYWFIEKFDLAEFKAWSESYGWGLCQEEQFGTIGYWTKTGDYKPADEKARAKVIATNGAF